MSDILIGSGKYKLQGTDGKSQVWEPNSKKYINLLTLSDKQAEMLLNNDFPYIIDNKENQEPAQETIKPKKSSMKK